MKFEITNAQGRVCCRSDDLKLLCPKCRAKATAGRQAAARSLEEYAPPDPYAAGIERMRRFEHIELTSDFDPRHKADPNFPPDGYAIALALDKAKAELENDR